MPRSFDGDCEHDEGVEITTLDNPGWSVRVNVAGTELDRRPFERVTVDRSEDHWVREPEPTNIFAVARAEKLRRRQVLVDALTGRPVRDEHGRFATRGGGFDGGARPVVAAPPDPSKSHAEVIVRLGESPGAGRRASRTINRTSAAAVDRDGAAPR